MKVHSREKIQQLIRRFHYLTAARGIKRPTFDPADLARQGYKSQSGQDKWVSETLLRGLRGGVFVDIGANDGMTFSNTLWLERQMGWTGLAIEPNPEAFAKLSVNRRCTTLNVCVSEKTGSVQQFEVDCYTLSDILSNNGIESVDYLSIDVEGAELSILQSIDLHSFQIRVIGVENNYQDYRIPQLLTHNGYAFHSVVGDEFYIRNP
jgi:hypothetical protein